MPPSALLLVTVGERGGYLMRDWASYHKRDWASLSYSARHYRVVTAHGKADRCIIYLCSTGCTRFEWASISRQHLDVMDYMPMCQVHHRQYDGIPDKMRASQTGRKASPETRAKIAAAQVGRATYRHTDETKAKLSVTTSAYWARKRNG
jgi:hypothetical protein